MGQEIYQVTFLIDIVQQLPAREVVVGIFPPIKTLAEIFLGLSWLVVLILWKVAGHIHQI